MGGMRGRCSGDITSAWIRGMGIGIGRTIGMGIGIGRGMWSGMGDVIEEEVGTENSEFRIQNSELRTQKKSPCACHPLSTGARGSKVEGSMSNVPTNFGGSA